MPDSLTSLSDIRRTHFEAYCQITDAVLAGTEKIDRIFLETVQRAVEEQYRYADALGNIRDVQKVMHWQASFWSGKQEQVQRFQQDCMCILAKLQNEIGRTTQTCMEQFGNSALQIMSTLQRPATTSRNHHTVSSNPFEPMMTVWEDAFPRASQPGDAAGTIDDAVDNRSERRDIERPERSVGDPPSIIFSPASDDTNAWSEQRRERDCDQGSTNARAQDRTEEIAKKIADITGTDDPGSIEGENSSGHKGGNGNGNRRARVSRRE